MATLTGLPINIKRNFIELKPLSYGDIDNNFDLINTHINKIQLINDTITSDYTLKYSDSGKLLLIENNNYPIVITVPKDGEVDFAIGQHIDIVRYGTYPVIITSDQDVTINSYDSKYSYSIRGQYDKIKLIKLRANEWLLSGELI